MAGFFNHQINNGMPGRSWRSFMQHIPGVGGGMYGDDNGMGMGGAGKGMMPPRPASRPLQRAQAAGRNGDTILAHINPEEMLALHLGTDGMSINPKTGLPEFFSEGDGPDGTGQGGDSGAAGGPGSAESPDDSPSNPSTDASAISDVVGMAMGQQGVFGGPASMINPQPAQVPFAALGGPIGMGMQTALSALAEGIGGGINAVTGATNEGAAAGQAAIGSGGPEGGPDGNPANANPNPWTSPGAGRPPVAPAAGWTSPAYYTYAPAILGRRPRGFLG